MARIENLRRATANCNLVASREGHHNATYETFSLPERNSC
jgi:hypothetical protein